MQKTVLGPAMVELPNCKKVYLNQVHKLNCKIYIKIFITNCEYQSIISSSSKPTGAITAFCMRATRSSSNFFFFLLRRKNVRLLDGVSAGLHCSTTCSPFSTTSVHSALLATSQSIIPYLMNHCSSDRHRWV